MNKRTIAEFSKSVLTEQDAVSSIEYALIGSLIAVVIVGAVGLLGTNNAALFTLVSNCVAFAVSGTGSCA
jgi:pilus assembly protein Flp/PilA